MEKPVYCGYGRSNWPYATIGWASGPISPRRKTGSAPGPAAWLPSDMNSGGSWFELLIRSGQMRTLRTGISHRQRHAAGQLALQVKIPLLGIGVRIVVDGCL